MLIRAALALSLVVPAAASAQTPERHREIERAAQPTRHENPEPKSAHQRKFEKKQRGCRAIPIPDECLN